MQPGEQCDARDRAGMWLKARVVALDPLDASRVKVHFNGRQHSLLSPLTSSSRARARQSPVGSRPLARPSRRRSRPPLRAGWSSKHDEWLAASSLEPPGSRTSPAQLAQQSLAQQKNEAEEKAKRKAEREAARTPPQNVVMQCVAPQRGRNRDGRVIQLGSVRHTLAPRFGL